MLVTDKAEDAKPGLETRKEIAFNHVLAKSSGNGSGILGAVVQQEG